MGFHRYTVIFDHSKTYKAKCANPECDTIIDKLSNRTKLYCSRRCSQSHRRRKAGSKPLPVKPGKYPDKHGNYLRHATCESWVAEWNAEHPKATADKLRDDDCCIKFAPII